MSDLNDRAQRAVFVRLGRDEIARLRVREFMCVKSTRSCFYVVRRRGEEKVLADCEVHSATCIGCIQRGALGESAVEVFIRRVEHSSAVNVFPFLVVRACAFV